MNVLEITEGKAREYAHQLVDFFGFEDRIIDNMLTPAERRLFYRLEQKGLISSRREETTLPNGNPWRIHYWRLERKTILSFAEQSSVEQPSGPTPEDASCGDIYEALSKEMWSARESHHL